MLKFIVPVIYFFRKEPAAVPMQCDRYPIGIGKAFGRILKLSVLIPARWAPCIPLYLRKADRISSYRRGAATGAHKPLVPELAGLIKRGDREFASWLKSNGHRCNFDDPVRKESGQQIGSTRTPVMACCIKGGDPQRISQIDNVLCQCDPTAITDGVLREESGQPKTTQIGGDGSEARSIQNGSDRAPGPDIVGPAM